MKSFLILFLGLVCFTLLNIAPPARADDSKSLIDNDKSFEVAFFFAPKFDKKFVKKYRKMRGSGQKVSKSNTRKSRK